MTLRIHHYTRLYSLEHSVDSILGDGNDFALELGRAKMQDFELATDYL